MELIKDAQEITIAIDSWDDVFSDFDPSPLADRVLSEDFILELRKRYRESSRGNFLVTIYAPQTLKDENSERIVLKRLKQYFKLRHLSLAKDIFDLRKKGGIFVLAGAIVLAVLTLLTYSKSLNMLTLDLLGIVLVPLGWFGIWEGFSRIIEPAPKLLLDLELFGKLSKATIKFKYASPAAPKTPPEPELFHGPAESHTVAK